MKKNLILLLIGLFLILGVSGYLYYNFFYQKDDIEVMSLIPENAIAVYESKNTISNWNNLHEKSFWSSLSPGIDHINNTFIDLDSITGKDGSLDKIFKNNPFCVSFHQTSKETIGTVYYFKVHNLEHYNILNKILKYYKKNDRLRTDKRTYLGETITEIREPASKKTFSYIIYKDHFVGSFFSVLLEDVIRNIESDGISTFKESNKALFNISGTKRDEENWYLNARRINSLLTIFSGINKNSESLVNFGESSRLNLEMNDQELNLNGFTYAGKSNNEYYLSTFKGQKAGKLQMSNLVPNRSAAFFHASFNDAHLWYENLVSFWNNKIPSQAKNHQQLLNVYDLKPAKFYKWMGGEIGLVTLQSMDLNNSDKLVIIKANDIQEAYNQMNKVASKADFISGDSLFKENFSEIDIRQLNINEFPSLLFGDHFSGFPSSFFSAIGNYIVIGNSLQVVKSTIADIEADNVWGKSVAMNQYFENTLGEANISYLINTQRAWNSINHHLNGNWKSEINSNFPALKNFYMLAVQFSNNGEHFYTNINVNHQKSSRKDNELQKFNLVTKFAVGAPIITKPYYLRSPGASTFQIMFQDSLLNLYKVSSEGEILWKESIGEKIVGEIFQVDYLKNGQYQYAFATPHAFHILSNEGSYINNNFPFPIEEAVEYMSVVDYDKSKNYRFILAASNGNLFMYDKQMEALEGWAPKKMDVKLATAPVHLRVRGKDCLILLQENGLLSVMNRKGELYPGFPVVLQGKFNTNLFIEPGPTFSQTVLTTISEKGELVKINLEGKLIKKEQFYRPSKETRFVLCIDEFQKNYIIARQELGILTLLDTRGEVILEKDYITSGALEIQYFNTGIEKEVYAVTDKIQEFTYLYDFRGNLINSRPIDSGHKIALHFTEATGKYEVMANFNTQFSRIDFVK